MPIQSCGEGEFKWGQHGHCYEGRAGAERQAQAAYANGYTGDAEPRGAGIALRAPGNRLLFLRRGLDSSQPGTWCFPGGKPEPGEDALETALRETEEETSFPAHQELDVNDAPEPVDTRSGFVTFLLSVDEEFEPSLDDGEHVDWMWATPEQAPEPLHPGVAASLEDGGLAEAMAGDAADCDMPWQAHDHSLIALDKNTVRRYDQDGRLHVATSNISKANVCPYFGREIPRWKELGLDPDKLYQLYRDPQELSQAAPTFNNLPVLSEHVPVTAEAHKPELVVGSTGTDAAYEHPYLCNSLVLWAKPAIDGVESEGKRELSSAYYYDADMVAGQLEDGTRYDGVMRNIRGNHVALVEDGRAGDDVMVGDAMPASLKQGSGKPPAQDSKEILMSKTVLTRKAALVQGALYAHLAPRLALDAQIDLGAAVRGVGPKNFKARKASIMEAVKKACEGKLAADADLDDVVELLDRLETISPAEAVDEDMPDAGKPVGAKDEDDEDDKDKDKPPAEDEDDEKDEKDKPPAAAKDEDEDDKDKDEKVSKGAMDAALKTVREDAKRDALAEARAIRDAEAAVRPYVGDLVAQDSAEGVYRTALKALGVDVKGVHPSAFPAILKAQQLPGTRQRQPSTPAMDQAGAKSYADRFPEAAAVKIL